jgi:hypothetical protein
MHAVCAELATHKTAAVINAPCALCAACQALKQKLANRRKFVPWGDSKPFSVPTLPAGLLKQPVLPLPEPKPPVSDGLHARIDAGMVPCLFGGHA